jgi:iron-sulfur cluster repair protein YtfE (RIC family)
MAQHQDVLVRITREHGRILEETQRLRLATEGGEVGRRSAVEAFVDFFQNDVVAHFRAEEGVLLPRMFQEPESVVEAMRLMQEHIQMDAVVRKIHDEVSGGTPGRDVMFVLAEMLEAHIRSEEQVAFPVVEGVAIGARERPTVAVCCLCDRVHTDRDFNGALLDTCIPCQAELFEAALQVRDDR